MDSNNNNTNNKCDVRDADNVSSFNNSHSNSVQAINHSSKSNALDTDQQHSNKNQNDTLGNEASGKNVKAP